MKDLLFSKLLWATVRFMIGIASLILLASHDWKIAVGVFVMIWMNNYNPK